MSDDGRRKGLGRGLAALLGESAGEEQAAQSREKLRELPVEQLIPNRFQPRQTFAEDGLAELAASVREKGVLQPILVRHGQKPGTYEIVAGERRWRAAQRAQLHQVPVVVRDLSDGEALEVALIENVQRRDLDAIEEALGYKRLVDEFGHTQEAVGQLVGKSRAVIANRLRLLSLPDAVQALLRERKLDEGHARALIGTDDPAALAAQIVAGNLTARQAEELAGGRKKGGASKVPPAKPVKDADTAALERDLTTAIGLAVSISHSGSAGEVKIAYKSLEQLDELCRLLSQGRRAPDSDDGGEDLIDGPPDPALVASELAHLAPEEPVDEPVSVSGRSRGR
jgi:ParB family chromosome partitioning protein